MHDAVPVREVQRGADVRDDLHGPPGLQRALLLQHVAQGVAVDVLHDDVRNRAGLTPGFAGVVHRDDRRVVQRGRVLRLTAESGLEGRVAGEVGTEHLDGHVPAKSQVAATVHLGHAAKAEGVPDLEPATEHLNRSSHQAPRLRLRSLTSSDRVGCSGQHRRRRSVGCGSTNPIPELVVVDPVVTRPLVPHALVNVVNRRADLLVTLVRLASCDRCPTDRADARCPFRVMAEPIRLGNRTGLASSRNNVGISASNPGEIRRAPSLLASPTM